jgi:hypothetical protein
MSENFRDPEAEPTIELVDGPKVAQYLTSMLKEQFIRSLVTANNQGVFDEEYEALITRSVAAMEAEGFRNYFFDPLDKNSQKLRELQRQRETGELEKDDFDFVQWFIVHPEEPLGRADLGRHALVLTWREFQQLGVLNIKMPSGKPFLDYNDVHDAVVFFPEDLG